MLLCWPIIHYYYTLLFSYNPLRIKKDTINSVYKISQTVKYVKLTYHDLLHHQIYKKKPIYLPTYQIIFFHIIPNMR